MKIIEQAALWLIDKFIYLLIGKKDFTPTLTPDDWPPDGSMHFLRIDHPIGSAELPPNAVQYEFAANVGEDNPKVLTLGQEIILRLCDSRQTLIVFTFDPELTKHERLKKTTPHFECMLQFLRSLVPGIHIAWKENLMAFLSVGCPQKIFSQYQAPSKIPYCFINFYLFSEEIMPPCPEEGLSQIKHGEYQANFYLDYGPNSLNAVFDSRSLDVTEIERVIQDVCCSYSIPLINPCVSPKSN